LAACSIKKGLDMASVIRDKEMQVSVQCLWDVITDFEKYPEFVDGVVDVKIKSPGNNPVVQYELEIIKRFKYELQFQFQPHTEVAWKLVESNFFKVNEGRWLLKELDKNRTQATYEVEVGFGFFVPKWVTKKLTEINLPNMFEAFEQRALSLSKV